MLQRTLFAAALGAAVLATAATAQAAPLNLGTANTSNTPTTLTGNTTGTELKVQNTNAAGGLGLYGILSSLTPTKPAAAVRGDNKATNAAGYGVYGLHAGSGTGVYGPSAKGVGVCGKHSATL